MKLNSTTKFLSLAVTMLFSIGIFAQPANDNVCDAIDLTGGMSSLIDNTGATVQDGEDALVPPVSTNCVPGTWCDQAEDGGAAIQNSAWFKFDAPADGSVTISGCLCNFDSQLAVYEVGDCSDFSSFNFVWATDDQVECGVVENPDMTTTAGLSSEMELECLTPGQTYYIIVDGWNTPTNSGTFEGTIELALTEIMPTGISVAIDSLSASAPTCMGGADGTVTAFTTGGSPPYTYAWSTGDTGQSLSDLAAGDYTFSVTDACGNTVSETATVTDGPAPTQITTAALANGVIHPTNCDDGSIDSGTSGNDGQISVGVSSGTPPFLMIWNTGDTTAFLNDLAPGTYTVTITDGCGNLPAVESFTLETAEVTGGTPAGEDIAASCYPSGIAIGGDASGLGQLSQLNSGDQTDDGNVACGVTIDGIRYYSENAYLRAFDLAGYGLSGTVKIEGVDFLLTAIAGPGFGGLQPNTYTLYTASSTDLATATLTEIVSVDAMVPDMATDYFRAPLEATVNASDILVVEIAHPGGGEDLLHQFAIGANEGNNTEPTYIRSGVCGISTPTLITDINFTQQTIMNIIFRNESENTYAWDDPNGGLNATNVAAPVASASDIYTVTVTDDCGNTVVDEVMVDCTVGIINPEDAAFTIAPNPSNGIFQLQNTDVAQNMTLQVFDLQGKMMQTEQFNGTLHTLDLSAFAAGIYVLKLDNGVDVETHKLIVY